MVATILVLESYLLSIKSGYVSKFNFVLSLFMVPVNVNAKITRLTAMTTTYQTAVIPMEYALSAVPTIEAPPIQEESHRHVMENTPAFLPATK